MKIALRAALLICLSATASLAADADWSRFRGPNGTATSTDSRLPLTWSESENLAWKTELPGPGSSSPIVFGQKVFVTCYSGYGVESGNPGDVNKLSRHLVCLNLADGKVLWKQDIPATVQEDPFRGQLTGHGYASSTPATDGKQVFTFFGKSGVFAFDMDGKQQWQQSVGTGSAIMGWGTGTSLVLHGDTVIVNANAESQSLVALNKASGQHVWKADTKGYNGSWSTPILVDVGGKQELALCMPDEIWGVNPNNGGLLWYCMGIRHSANTSLVAKDGVVYALGGGPRGSGCGAVRAGGRDDVSGTHVVWKGTVGSYVTSPVLSGEYLCWVDDKGVACCLNASTGEQAYRQRLPDAPGVYASILSAGDRLYVVSRRKGTYVLAAGPAFKQLAHNQFASDKTDFNASPAVADGKLLLRSNRFIYCLATK